MKFEFFYHSLCNVCKKYCPDLRQCSFCKRVFYCSIQHQIIDVTSHRETCKMIGRIRRIFTLPENATLEEYTLFKTSLPILWQREVGRALTHFENQLWMFPRVCPVCFSHEAPIICKACLSVAYCDLKHKKVHRKKHQEFCSKLMLALDVTYALYENEYKDLIRFYLEGEPPFPEDIEGLVNILKYDKEVIVGTQQFTVLILTDLLSHVASTVFILKEIGVINDHFAVKTHLVIHILVTGDFETHWIFYARFLAYWLKNVPTVDVLLVVPDIAMASQTKFPTKCPICNIDSMLTLTITNESYAKAAIPFPKPDLIVITDTFFQEYHNAEFNSFTPYYFQSNVPLMYMTFLEQHMDEMFQDIDQNEVEFFVRPQENPYGSRRPMRNYKDAEDPVVYFNRYIAACKRK